MFLSDRTMQLLMELEAPADKKAALLQALLADEAAARPIRSSNAERQARHRAKKKAEAITSVTEITPVTSRVTEHNANEMGNNGGVTSPRPLPLSPQTPLSPTPTRDGDTRTRGEADLGFDEPEPPIPKSRRGTRLPEGWEPTEADVARARAEGLTDEEIHRAATEFRNYWCSRTRDATKLDWARTWHNRVLEIADRQRRRGPRLVASSAQSGGGGRGAVSFADIYARRHGHTAD